MTTGTRIFFREDSTICKWKKSVEGGPGSTEKDPLAGVKKKIGGAASLVGGQENCFGTSG